MTFFVTFWAALGLEVFVVTLVFFFLTTGVVVFFTDFVFTMLSGLDLLLSQTTMDPLNTQIVLPIGKLTNKINTI